MDPDDPGCLLTAADHATCTALVPKLERAGSPLLPLLVAKLERATIIDDEKIDPLVASLNSRLQFRIDDAPPQTRILVGCEFRNGLVGLTLPVTTPYGLALLGLRQGRSVVLDRDGGRSILRLERTVYQPQAARHRRRPGIVSHHQNRSADIIDLAQARNRKVALTRRVSL